MARVAKLRRIVIRLRVISFRLVANSAAPCRFNLIQIPIRVLALTRSASTGEIIRSCLGLSQRIDGDAQESVKMSGLRLMFRGMRRQQDFSHWKKTCLHSKLGPARATISGQQDAGRGRAENRNLTVGSEGVRCGRKRGARGERSKFTNEPNIFMKTQPLPFLEVRLTQHVIENRPHRELTQYISEKKAVKSRRGERKQDGWERKIGRAQPLSGGLAESRGRDPERQKVPTICRSKQAA